MEIFKNLTSNIIASKYNYKQEVFMKYSEVIIDRTGFGRFDFENQVAALINNWKIEYPENNHDIVIFSDQANNGVTILFNREPEGLKINIFSTIADQLDQQAISYYSKFIEENRDKLLHEPNESLQIVNDSLFVVKNILLSSEPSELDLRQYHQSIQSTYILTFYLKAFFNVNIGNYKTQYIN